RSDTECGRGNG
ncbi:hypothetical protein D018_5049B, partial [Vibrio parahaemolyticus VP2007-007]